MQVQIFNQGHMPADAQLEATCDLFRTALPVFDEVCAADNKQAIELRATPQDYGKLLETRTLLLAKGAHDSIAGILEWDQRDVGDVTVAYITWLLVHPEERGKGVSSALHRSFETECVPGVIQGVQKTVYQGLGVHLKNPALNIYRKWGYSEDGAPQWNDGRRLFMAKAPRA